MITHPVATARTYVLVWLGLLALLAFTLGTAYLRLGWFNGVINLVVAIAKALLVMTIFMHLRSSHVVLRVCAAVGFVWITILIGLALADYLAR
jgi:cytochrome c oxidase subunit 4